MRSKFTRLYKRMLSFFPTPLPRGMEEFDTYIDNLLELYDIPQLDSYRHAVATMIMHLGPTTSKIAPRYFAHSIFKAMANEVAYQKIQDIKHAAEEAKKAATLTREDLPTLPETSLHAEESRSVE